MKLDRARQLSSCWGVVLLFEAVSFLDSCHSIGVTLNWTENAGSSVQFLMSPEME